MRPGSLLATAGFILLIASTWSPLLRPFHLLNWNVYDLNKPYGVIILLTAAIGVVAALLNQVKLMRYAAVVAFFLVASLYLAAVLKVNTTFSFIPFKIFANYLVKQVKFKWGWLFMLAGVAVSFIGAFSIKKQFARN